MKRDWILKTCLAAVSYFSVGVVVFLLAFFIIKGLDNISFEFLFEFPENSMADGGIFPAIVGTLYFLAIAMVFAIPVGIMAAVYLSEYSRDNWLKKFILAATNILAGIPSVVFGLFGLSLFSITLGFGTSVISGGLTLGIMALPYIISNTHESLKAVPNSYREASTGLGATKGETTFKIILPAAFGRTITGVIISVGRIIGETAPILFTGAAFYITRNPSDIFKPAMSLPTHIFVLSAIYPESVTPKLEGTISVLMIIVILLFAAVSLLRARELRKMEG